MIIPRSGCVPNNKAECTHVVPLIAGLPTHSATNLGTDACADTSILDTCIARSESLNDWLSLSLFSVEEKVQVDLGLPVEHVLQNGQQLPAQHVSKLQT